MLLVFSMAAVLALCGAQQMVKPIPDDTPIRPMIKPAVEETPLKQMVKPNVAASPIRPMIKPIVEDTPIKQMMVKPIPEVSPIKVMPEKVMPEKVMPEKVMMNKDGVADGPQSQATETRLLSLPEADLCKNRPKQWQHGGHNYFFTWDQDEFIETNETTGKLTGRKVDWLEARNDCRKRCMDAVSMETEDEMKMIFDFIKERNITFIWTSGRLCDFTGCNERQDLKPLSVFGWFWSNTNTKMAPTNATPPGWSTQPWSAKGHFGGPQPDNAEFDINQTSESCLAVLNNIYKDGIGLHDIACYHKKPVICEDSEALLQFIKASNPGIVL